MKFEHKRLQFFVLGAPSQSLALLKELEVSFDSLCDSLEKREKKTPPLLKWLKHGYFLVQQYRHLHQVFMISFDHLLRPVRVDDLTLKRFY